MNVTATPADAVREGVAAAAPLTGVEVLRALDVVAKTGLTGAQVAERRLRYGPNAVASYRPRLLAVLWRQLRSPLLALLLTASAVSFFVGERASAVVIAVIIALSVGLGSVNEYRAERAAQALHDQVRHRCVVTRDGRPEVVDVADLVPGDLVDLRIGDIVPADLRLLEAPGLECNESVLTGESLPVVKATAPVPAGTALADLTCCALMGTVVTAGGGRGAVVATGSRSEFGAIAAGLGTQPLETEFQVGLRRFSMMLVYVAGALTTGIFIANVVLNRPVIDALLFSLAIAVGITPQLLPAVVASSLAAGSRALTRRRVLVKRLVCIEDLGDVQVLFTDKTGTLTEGRIEFVRARPVGDDDPATLLRLGLLATENEVVDGRPVGGNPLDDALWSSPQAAGAAAGPDSWQRLGVLPFDHQRRRVSVLTARPGTPPLLITKGAPEDLLALCVGVPAGAQDTLQTEFAAGNRVVAVASRELPGDSGGTALTVDDENSLRLRGFLVFLDPPKPDAATSLQRLAGLGIDVKIVTGDNPQVAAKVCRDLGLALGDVLTGRQVAALDDDALAAALPSTTVLARVSPQDKARIVRVQRRHGDGVAFLGDGVNDALALHAADVGISVDSATDVAKDAADVILLAKDLDVLADGVVEGRRIFANTMKYVLMGTSSNFGNMFSAAGASVFLSFLPMLPSQILLTNLLYDTSQLTIPTDNVDDEQLRRPSHWDIGLIRKFMLVFGPVSSVFDFATFAVMLGVFHAGPELFRSGWFVESLATQTLIVFAIRTHRVPFLRSRPSLPLVLSAAGVVAVGVALTFSPLAPTLGFTALPAAYFAALAAMVLLYLLLIEAGKWLFFAAERRRPAGAVRAPARPLAVRFPERHRRLRRRLRYFGQAVPHRVTVRRPRPLVRHASR